MKKIKTVIAKFLGITQAFEEFERKFKTLEGEIKENEFSQSQLDELGSKVDDLESELSDCNDSTSNTDSRVDDLESRIDDLEESNRDVASEDYVNDAIDDKFTEHETEWSEKIDKAIAESRKDLTKEELESLLKEVLASNAELKELVRKTLLEVLSGK